MEKFLYFANTTANACCIPARKFKTMDIDGSGTALDIRFDTLLDSGSSLAGLSDTVDIDLTITDNKGKEVMKAIANEIRSGNKPMVVIADDLLSEYAHGDLTAVGTIPSIS